MYSLLHYYETLNCNSIIRYKSVHRTSISLTQRGSVNIISTVSSVFWHKKLLAMLLQFTKARRCELQRRRGLQTAETPSYFVLSRQNIQLLYEPSTLATSSGVGDAEMEEVGGGGVGGSSRQQKSSSLTIELRCI